MYRLIQNVGYRGPRNFRTSEFRAVGGTLGKRKPWNSGKFGWSRFDQDVVGARRWRVRCGLPTTQKLANLLAGPDQIHRALS
jgi:hypothetical protein